jgi:hypothetical protein
MSEGEAYKVVRKLAYRYAERRASARGARGVAARLAMALLVAGLPMSAAAAFEPRLSGGYYVLSLRRPRGAVHEYVVFPEEVEEIRRWLEEAQRYYGSGRSLVRSLQYELSSFREAYGLDITPLDVYALKLWVRGMVGLLTGRYSARRLKLVLDHILARAEQGGDP